MSWPAGRGRSCAGSRPASARTDLFAEDVFADLSLPALAGAGAGRRRRVPPARGRAPLPRARSGSRRLDRTVTRLPDPVRGALGGRRAAVVLPRADPLRRHRRADQRAGRLLHRRLGRGRAAAARRRRCGCCGPDRSLDDRWRATEPSAAALLAQAEAGLGRRRRRGRHGAFRPGRRRSRRPTATSRRGSRRCSGWPAASSTTSTPGLLPVRLHAAYEAIDEPAPRARLAAALARCWAYANEPRRARPFAIEALHLADQQDDPVLLADALDAALASHWGPDDLARAPGLGGPAGRRRRAPRATTTPGCRRSCGR